jgi:hypothetical protein
MVNAGYCGIYHIDDVGGGMDLGGSAARMPALTVRFGRFAGLTAIPEIGIASRITRPPDVIAFH